MEKSGRELTSSSELKAVVDDVDGVEEINFF